VAAGDVTIEQLPGPSFLVTVAEGSVAEVWRRAVAVACERGIDVLVGPEFMAPTDVAVSESSKLAGEHPSIMLAGSRHTSVEDRSFNEAVLYVRGVERLRHRKLVPFEDAVLGMEAIESGSTLTVVHGDGWRIGTLTCADVNSEDLVALVASLGPNLVLVPAWTHKSGVFPERLPSIGASCQAFVVFANGPVPDERSGLVPQAFLWSPVRPDPVKMQSEPLVRQVALFRVGDDVPAVLDLAD
jgi:predicted amidohydrolase